VVILPVKGGLPEKCTKGGILEEPNIGKVQKQKLGDGLVRVESLASEEGR